VDLAHQGAGRAEGGDRLGQLHLHVVGEGHGRAQVRAGLQKIGEQLGGLDQGRINGRLGGDELLLRTLGDESLIHGYPPQLAQ
jgi:hypothetical protein